MRYALLICRDENDVVDADPARVAAVNPFLETAGERLVGSARLRPTSAATTVKVRDGTVVIADGPFAETKEQIGGFLLVECENLDDAIELAAQIPTAQFGTIEVRPVWEI